jgi:PAS domain S-box-containing protein
MASIPPRSNRQQAAPALYQLLSDSALSRAALNACGIPLALLGVEKRTVSYVNAAFSAYFGFGEAEALGKSIGALLLRGDEALAQRVLADCPSAWPLTAWRKDGAVLQLQLALGALRGADGRLTHWVLTFSDRTEIERLRAELESLKALSAAPYLRLEATAQPARATRPSSAETARDRPAS